MPEQDPILIVASDTTARTSIVAQLAAMELHTDVAGDAETALQYLRAQPDCHLVLSQAELPEAGSLTLLDAIAQEFPGIPVVVFSAEPHIASVTEAFRHGAFDFLAEPCRPELLLSTVGAALEHGRLRRQSLAYRQNLEDLISERTARLRVAIGDLERSYDATLEAMGDALDLRDAETEGHSKRVTAYTIALARAMRLPAAQLKTIARGAFLHDIGKIAIPDSILLKPGKLTFGEIDIMREHCLRGYEMVRKLPFLAEAAEIVYAHQEAFDGSGYPRGLRGQDIPLGARIFAIADTLDAMTSDRPYRKAMSFAAAIEEIHRCQGKQFDPEIVSVFLSLPLDTWTAIRAKVGRNLQTTELFRAAAA